MDDQQNLNSQSLRERAWTTDEIRKHSSNWTLAGDVGLFNLLNEFSHNIISRTHEVENAVDSLVHQTKMTSAKINNVINDFHMLSNLQFVENRVYDEEVQESVPESKPVVEKTKEQKEAEMLPKIMRAIEFGLAVLDTQFDRINVNEISDSEDEDISSEGRTILEPKDPYEHRSLPYIIGSEEFMKCDYAGLKELVEEDVQSFSEESSLSETDETSSDEGEPLPLDEDDKYSGKQSDKVSQIISDRISSSDESELFGSEKEVNSYASDASLDFKTKEKNIQRPPMEAQPEKETKQNSVASLQAKLKLPQVLAVPKLQEKKKEDDLFANDEENSDDESPFRKKTGLFTSEIRFDEEKDEDLFGGDLFGKSPSKEVKKAKPVDVPKASSKKPQTTTPTIVPDTKEPDLFDNAEDSDDDIFNTLMKTKKTTTSKTSNASSQDSSEKADTSSTPSSAPSMTIKPSGNAFDFGTDAGNGGSLFGDDSDGDDLFASKKTSQGKKFDFDTPEDDDLFGIVNSQPIKETKVTTESKPSLFADSKIPEQPKKVEPQKSLLAKTKKDSIFEDSDSSDQEKPVPVKSPISVPVKSKKEPSLFDDDDFEDDIFTQSTKKKAEPAKAKKADEKLSLFDENSKQVSKESSVKTVEKPKPSSIFGDTEESSPKKSKPVKTVDKSKDTILFDDAVENVIRKIEPILQGDIPNSGLFQDDTEKELPKSVPKKDQKKPLSLFEDSDNFDLFAPKPTVKKSEPSVPVQVPKPATEIVRTKDEIDGLAVSKVSSPAKEATIGDQVSFDAPIDSTNVLNVINKGRVKVATKRRKPTRQGRLAALEDSEKEAEPAKPISAPAEVDESSDNLFSTSATKPKVQTEAPKSDYKAQEKQKMNLMSQLMSEVTTSKIAIKKSVEKVEVVEDDDEVDIFSEATKKDRSKSSFSFLPPEQNGIASMFPVEKKEEEKEDFNVSKSDSYEDDFFTEPAFQNFRSSISHKDPVLDLEDDEDDDDLFNTIKTGVLPKSKLQTSDDNDLFDDDTDIFAHVEKEKYEMFPNQIYEDEDDDIFGSVAVSNSNKPPDSVKTSNTSSVKKVETQQVNAFDDPLTGLLGDD